MTESILWSVRILCWSLALPRIRRVNAVPFVELRNELGNAFGVILAAILVAGPGLLHSRTLVADVEFNSFAPR
jgi:hypothetical protein